MSRTLTLGLVVASLLASGCAARRPGPARRTVADVAAEVDGLVREGCYHCLRAALKALPPPGSPLDARRLRVLTLLGSRARQLDLHADPDWLAEGRALAASATPGQQLLLDLAALTQPPAASSAEPLDGTRRTGLAANVAALLSPGQEDAPVAGFFLEQARCMGLVPPSEPAAGEARSGIPLVEFGAVTCRPIDLDALDAFAAAHPRFSELHLFKALGAFSTGALLTSERELDAFDEAFQPTPASAMLRGQIFAALEEWEAAVAAFDRVLAARPDQPDALLHHMRALSQMGDASGGEAAADRLIRLGTWHQGDAFYWRAWNRRALGRLEEAAADVETARRVLFNAAVPKLAGFIAFERGRMEVALAELTASRDRQAGDCEVQFAIGQVHARERRWAEAQGAFTTTIDCTRKAQSAADADLAEIARAPLDPQRRERMRLRAERRRGAEHTREGLATFNAGTVAVLGGRPDAARPLLERAAAWPQWADRAREQLAALRP